MSKMFFETIDTACIDPNDLPWTPFTPYTDEVHVKLLRVDPVKGETVTMLRAPVGMQLPKHHHSGTVQLYTIAGAWKYLEHDWVAKPGDVVLETAGSSHTPVGVEGYGDEIITFQITTGDLLYLDENDQVCAIENWKSAMDRYLAYCHANDIAPKDLSHA
ncbi:2,4'-dihydroxyacetophenone dioxygenase family protein [Microbulbifer elongatus]|uniref:2,4'-dihydroxyacetophenone dioxygenase family protein n=1 Tax=Microbulbifer elongatus TaxID=86173 RepID=UPI001E3BDF42|nr:2,4'-dihydroxyacetophenone dioxygenase family protein [Microbulbifer elongatus]